MANVTIHQLETSNQPSLNDEVALYEVSSDNTKNTTLNTLKGTLGVTTLEDSMSEIATELENDIQQVRGEIPSNLKNGSSTGSLRTISSKIEDSSYTIGSRAFAEGYGTQASGVNSHAEGLNTKTSGNASHAEGRATEAIGTSSHAEGYDTEANGTNSHAEGQAAVTTGSASHAEGYTTYAEGDFSHAEGFKTIASGKNSHAEGNETQANGENSHAGGHGTIAIGDQETAIGRYNLSSGVIAEFTGDGTTSTFNLSVDHADKVTVNNYQVSTWSSQNNQLTFTTPPRAGVKIVAYCAEEGKTFGEKAFIIGNGTGSNNRSNAFSIDWNGSVWVSKNIHMNNDTRIYSKDSAGNQFQLIGRGPNQIRIGAGGNSQTVADVIIHSGIDYRDPTKGNQTIQIEVPNPETETNILYKVLHTGNMDKYVPTYAKANQTYNFNMVMVGGLLTGTCRSLVFTIPWSKAYNDNLTWSLESLSIAPRFVSRVVQNNLLNYGVYGYMVYGPDSNRQFFSLHDGTGNPVEIWSQGQAKYNNSINSIDYVMQQDIGIRIRVNFSRCICFTDDNVTFVQETGRALQQPNANSRVPNNTPAGVFLNATIASS